MANDNSFPAIKDLFAGSEKIDELISSVLLNITQYADLIIEIPIS